MRINIKDIVVKYEYFPRVSLNKEIVARYKEIYELGETLPPIVLQKEKLIPIDGYHRLDAQMELDRTTVEAVLMDIPEKEIFPTAIRLNIQHGLPPSTEDRTHQIRILRFETEPPWTYEQIGNLVLLSPSRVGEICRKLEQELKINGTINTKVVDGRRNITPEQEEEIQDRLDKGEPTSKIAKDYPVSESRISQLRKTSQRKKAMKSLKTSRWRPLYKMPKAWILRAIKKRFIANNPRVNPDLINFEENFNVEDFEAYQDLVDDYKRNFPEYEWYYPKERGSYDYHSKIEIPPLEIHDTYVTIKLKLYWTNNKKYAQVKGTIPKRLLYFVRDILEKEAEVKWPLTEEFIIHEDQRRQFFRELSDEELAEMEEKAQEQYRPFDDEPPEDEEMKKWADLYSKYVESEKSSKNTNKIL